MTDRPRDPECIFCKIVAGEIPSNRVAEDDTVHAFRDLAPRAPTHILLVPRTHIASADKLTEDDAGLLGRIFATAAEIARSEGISEAGYRIVTANAAAREILRLPQAGLLVTAIREPDVLEALDLDPTALTVETAIPCGLILNELITNSLKHSFPDGRRGRIEVRLRENGPGQVSIGVRDDGVGVPADFKPQSSTSLGMQLVLTLASQLRGTLRVVSESGADFSVTFPT